MKDYDVVVLGGGLVGLMFSHLLVKHSSLKVAVIDRQAPKVDFPDESYDLRTIALSLASKTLFENIGLWQTLCQKRHGCYKNMEVWDAEHVGQIAFDAHEVGLQQLGWIFENRLMVKTLYQALESHPQVDFYFGLVAHQETIKNKIVLEFSDQTSLPQLTTRLLVGADGGQSWLRGQMQVPVNVWSYQQKAIVTNLETEHPHQNVARQRFKASGPLAFLPLDHPNRVAIVWSCDSHMAERLLALDDQAFAEQLCDEMDGQYGKTHLVSPRAAFPLRRIHGEHYVCPRQVLIGDAAHVVHPLAGQGVNLGFLDAAALAEVLVNASKEQLDIGHALVLRRYERGRKGHNKLTQSMMSYFYQLFGAKQSSLKLLRSMGLKGVNELPFVKKELILRACGLKGDVPAYAQPSC